ncbi:uncharacterized protein BDW70DRAFT_27166 [Aspergillus foveolatus]|uniref:uncharacterized protein n=1 Tax=Aspergillus foveolatus TaxID=210207 RepID=UPI003CCCF0AE
MLSWGLSFAIYFLLLIQFYFMYFTYSFYLFFPLSFFMFPFFFFPTREGRDAETILQDQNHIVHDATSPILSEQRRSTRQGWQRSGPRPPSLLATGGGERQSCKFQKRDTPRACLLFLPNCVNSCTRTSRTNGPFPRKAVALSTSMKWL